MVLRITKLRGQDNSVTVVAEGTIASESVVLLERECSVVIEDGRSLRLNLMDVDFVDQTGVEMLKLLVNRGVVIEEASLTVRGLLQLKKDDA